MDPSYRCLWNLHDDEEVAQSEKEAKHKKKKKHIENLNKKVVARVL